MILLLALLACSRSDGGLAHGLGQGTVCDAGSCAGCCLPDGSCAAGGLDTACGHDGASCTSCAEVDEVCSAQVCLNEALDDQGLVDDREIHILDDDDAARVRGDLIDFIWGQAGFPDDAQPDDVEEDVTAPVLDGQAARVDRLTIDEGGGYVSLVYAYVPADPSGRLVLVQQGHSPTLDVGGIDGTIAWFLDRGDLVLTLYMPLYGEYTGPASSHDEMIYGAPVSDKPYPIALFLDPVARSLNYALQTWDIDDVTMTGVSGGGWTTTLYAALDDRVRTSFPVAGSLPIYLRTSGDLGDAEQLDTNLYSIADYEDLYVLDGWGEGRVSVQVLNRYDSCCFWGTRYQDYAESVTERVGELSAGSWSFFLDESHTGHEISEHAREAAFAPVLDGEGVQILDDLYPAWGAFATTGTWTDWTDQGFGLTLQSAPPGSGESAATWSFSVEPGDWVVYATWVAYDNRASNAPYTLSCDDEQTVTVDQRVAPADLDDNGATWARLGTVACQSGTLTVRLSDAANGYVIADAVRVEPAP